MSQPSSSEAPAPAPASAPKIAERAVQAQGIRIVAVMSDSPRALLARAPLIVLPAAGYTWEAYRPILEKFAPTRRVFALDWPGFGGSAAPSPTDFTYSAAGYADLLAAWLDTLGIAQGVLLGNGIGAAAALRYAAAHPKRVAGLALVSPVGFSTPGLFHTATTRLLGSPALLRWLEPTLMSFSLGPTTTETSAILQRRRASRSTPEYAASLGAHAALWRSGGSPDADLTSIAKEVLAPTIVVRGALDPIISAADARRAAERIGVGHTLEIVLPEAGHLPFLQQPDRFYQAIEGLVQTAEVNALASAQQQ